MQKNQHTTTYTTLSTYSHTYVHVTYIHTYTGTAADHHVHHKMFIFNYGHLFMWWDMLAGTYRYVCVCEYMCVYV